MKLKTNKFWKSQRLWKIVKSYNLQVGKGNIMAQEDTVARFPVIKSGTKAYLRFLRAIK